MTDTVRPESDLLSAIDPAGRDLLLANQVLRDTIHTMFNVREALPLPMGALHIDTPASTGPFSGWAKVAGVTAETYSRNGLEMTADNRLQYAGIDYEGDTISDTFLILLQAFLTIKPVEPNHNFEFRIVRNGVHDDAYALASTQAGRIGSAVDINNLTLTAVHPCEIGDYYEVWADCTDGGGPFSVLVIHMNLWGGGRSLAPVAIQATSIP